MVILLATLAACRGEFRAVGEARATAPAEGVRTVAAVTNVGEVRVRAAPGPEISVRAWVRVRAGMAVASADSARDLLVRREGDLLRVENAHMRGGNATDWQMDLLIDAPAGLNLRVTTGVGEVLLSGDWETVQAHAGVGRLEIEGGRISGGKITAGVGDLLLRARGAGPSSDFCAETGTGSISIEVPAAWKGRLNFSTGAGKIDAGPKVEVSASGAGSTLLWDVDAQSPGLWAKTGVGDIRFRREKP